MWRVMIGNKVKCLKHQTVRNEECRWKLHVSHPVQTHLLVKTFNALKKFQACSAEVTKWKVVRVLQQLRTARQRLNILINPFRLLTYRLHVSHRPTYSIKYISTLMVSCRNANTSWTFAISAAGINIFLSQEFSDY